ncbi:MAG: hypothetical protein IPI05_06785 [Flavobacteriales bacterium]|nr:hypothetical protein [Flavobacteriales bacterium]
MGSTFPVVAQLHRTDRSSVQWATFSDTAIGVNVSNASIGFDYPGFILFDANGRYAGEGDG